MKPPWLLISTGPSPATRWARGRGRHRDGQDQALKPRREGGAWRRGGTQRSVTAIAPVQTPEGGRGPAGHRAGNGLGVRRGRMAVSGSRADRTRLPSCPRERG